MTNFRIMIKLFYFLFFIIMISTYNMCDFNVYFSTINEDTNSNSRQIEFTKQLVWWNEHYSDVFKFINDKAGVPEELETTQILRKSAGVTYKTLAEQGLKSLIDLLNEYEEATIEIDAHTSSPAAGRAWGGSNENLSQARADNMKKYIIKLSNGKISEDRIVAVGMGFKEPFIHNDKHSPEAQLKNRRATVKIDKPFKSKKKNDPSIFPELKISLNFAMPLSSGAGNMMVGDYFGVTPGSRAVPTDKNFQELKDIVMRSLQNPTMAQQTGSKRFWMDMVNSKKFTWKDVSDGIDRGDIQLIF